MIAKSVEQNRSALSTPGIQKAHIHSEALVASLCLDDLFNSELIIELVLKTVCSSAATQKLQEAEWFEE